MDLGLDQQVFVVTGGGRGLGRATADLLVAEGARVVVFAFDAGQELREHSAAFPVLLQALTGHLQVTADGRTVDLEPGGVVHMTTRLPHAVRAVVPSRLMLTMLDPAAR